MVGSDGSLLSMPGERPMTWGARWSGPPAVSVREACVGDPEAVRAQTRPSTPDWQAGFVLGVVDVVDPIESDDGSVVGRQGRIVGLWVDESVSLSLRDCLRKRHDEVRWFAGREGLLRRYGFAGPGWSGVRPRGRDPLVISWDSPRTPASEHALPDLRSAAWQPRGPAQVESGWVRQIVDSASIRDGVCIGLLTDQEAQPRVCAEIADVVSRYRLRAGLLLDTAGRVQLCLPAPWWRPMSWTRVAPHRVKHLLGSAPCLWAPGAVGVEPMALAMALDQGGCTSVDFEWPDAVPVGRGFEEQIALEEAVTTLRQRWYRESKAIVAAAGWGSVIEPAIPWTARSVVDPQDPIVMQGRDSIREWPGQEGDDARAVLEAAVVASTVLED